MKYRPHTRCCSKHSRNNMSLLAHRIFVSCARRNESRLIPSLRQANYKPTDRLNILISFIIMQGKELSKNQSAITHLELQRQSI